MRDVTLTLHEDGRTVKARYYPVFYFDQGVNCELIPLFILADGGFILGDRRIDVRTLRELIEKEFVMTVLPEGQPVYVPEVTSFRAVSVINAVSEAEFLREIDDIIRELNGQLTTLELCRQAWDSYSAEPTAERREDLKAAYERVPEHNRCWLGTFDSKDISIRKAIYGKDWRP